MILDYNDTSPRNFDAVGIDHLDDEIPIFADLPIGRCDACGPASDGTAEAAWRVNVTFVCAGWARKRGTVGVKVLQCLLELAARFGFEGASRMRSRPPCR